MRILALVTDAFGGQGGIAKFNRDLLFALCAHPATERVVALPRLLSEVPVGLPAKLDYSTSGVGGKLRYSIAVVKSAIANRQSAIILCCHIHLLPIAFAARLFCHAPIVLVIHGIDAWQPTRSWLANRLVHKIDVFISVSEFTKKRFLEWSKLDGVRSFILPNCVDLAQFTPGPKNPALLERHGLRGRTVLLTVARLSASERYKGVDEVMEVMPELAKQIPNLSYLIVGDGSDRIRLEQKAAQLGLKDRVVFAGRITEEEKVDHYRLADAFVMPGRGEGFGIVYLEALACGVPVMASKADASAEILGNIEPVVLVDPDDPDEISAGILKTLGRQTAGGVNGLECYSRDSFERRVFRFLEAMARQH